MEDITLSGFGDILKAYRKRRKISQQELASRMDVHRNTIGGWERGDVLPESKAMVLELAKQLLLAENETRRLLEASLTTVTPYWNIPYQRNPFFTGRTNLLQTLYEQLRAKQAIALCQSYALSGLGGIGKTQLALEYAYYYALDYRAIFWVAAETVDTLFSSFATIADLMQLPEREEKDHRKMVEAVLRWFTTHDEWLLIFDNVENISMLKSFLPAARQGAILITTRLHSLSGLAHALELLPFSIEEGIQFLLHRSGLLSLTGSREYLLPEEVEAARALVEMLDGLPLALDQAGAYIEKTGCNLADYRQLYQEHKIHLLDERSESADHPSSVVKTFLLSFERISQTDPVAADVLQVCAFLAPEAIPEELFTRGAAHLGPVLSSAATDAYIFNRAIGEALHYSLLQRNSQNKNISLHRLLQVVLKATMDHTSYMQWVTRIIETIAYLGSSIEGEQIWSHYTRWFPHAQQVNHLIEELNIVSLEATQVIYHVGRYLHEHGSYTSAEPLLLRALHIGEEQLGTEHPDIVRTLNGLADLYRLQGKYEQAESLYQRALYISEETPAPGREHPDVVRTLNGLADLYRQQGKYEQAESLFQRALCISEQVPGLEHSNVARTLGGLANIYFEQGKYEQAEPLYQRALHIREQTLGLENPNTARTLNNLAGVYFKLGKYEQVEALLQKALHINEQALGLDHPTIAYALGNLAELFRQQGKYERAEPLCQRALLIQEKALGLEHPMVAYALGNLASIYRLQGMYALAEPLLQRALNIWEQQVQPEHPNMANTLNELANLYYGQKKYAEAELLFYRALAIREQALEWSHPDIAETLHSFAVLREEQGNSEEAASLYYRVLAIREKVYGSQHPKTTDTRERLLVVSVALSGTEEVANPTIIQPEQGGNVEIS